MARLSNLLKTSLEAISYQRNYSRPVSRTSPSQISGPYGKPSEIYRHFKAKLNQAVGSAILIHRSIVPQTVASEYNEVLSIPGNQFGSL